MGQLFGAGVVPDRSRRLCRALVCLGILFALGCGRDIGPPAGTEGLDDLQPVTGSVLFEGKPTPGAVVLFVPSVKPEAFRYRVAGIVDEDGNFEMQTTVPEGTRPGVAPGQYLVTVSWTEPIDPDDKDTDLRELLPEKYTLALSSGLRVEIDEGANELEAFELTR